MRRLNRSFAVLATAAAMLAGCKDDPKPQTPGGTQGGGTPAATTPAANAPAAPAASPAKSDKDEHHNQTTLGETTIAGLKLKAMQDEPVKPGGEGAFDLVITGYPAGGKPKAVRFWVGVESGDGSTKAKAEEEKPDNWHTHVEVPKPIPAGSKFWAEVEPATGAKFKVSFDMKQ
ncbi:MAG TPA: hypothetical protein VEA69_09775 [Tepidisphaeraceae bacterium]|nr:hypothetical protein [Tepidisphaeraceae bacterium]